MAGGTGQGLSGCGIDVPLVGAGHGIVNVHFRTWDTEDREVGTGEFEAGFTDERLTTAIFFIGWVFTEEEDTGGFGTGGGYRGAGVGAEGATVHGTLFPSSSWPSWKRLPHVHFWLNVANARFTLAS